MPSKKGKSYMWIAKKDFAYDTTKKRTFAICFNGGNGDMDAMQWKSQVEDSKNNNLRVRRGINIPDLSDVDDVCSTFMNLSSITKSSTSPLNSCSNVWEAKRFVGEANNELGIATKGLVIWECQAVYFCLGISNYVCLEMSDLIKVSSLVTVDHNRC